MIHWWWYWWWSRYFHHHPPSSSISPRPSTFLLHLIFPLLLLWHSLLPDHPRITKQIEEITSSPHTHRQSYVSPFRKHFLQHRPLFFLIWFGCGSVPGFVHRQIRPGFINRIKKTVPPEHWLEKPIISDRCRGFWHFEYVLQFTWHRHCVSKLNFDTTINFAKLTLSTKNF